MTGDVIWGKYNPKKTPKMGVNRQFQAKTAKYENYNISELMNLIKTKNLRTNFRPTITLLGWSHRGSTGPAELLLRTTTTTNMAAANFVVETCNN